MPHNGYVVAAETVFITHAEEKHLHDPKFDNILLLIYLNCT